MKAHSAALSRRIFVVGGLLGSIGRARADMYDDYINSKSKIPFVSFLARTSDGSLGKPGHSYVALGVELDNGLKVYERILGYYPKSNGAWEEIKAVFSKVTGDLKYKMQDVTWSVEFYSPTNVKGHDAAAAVMKRWSSNDPKYQLFANGGKNCSAFAGEVAAAIGLKVPAGAGSKFPINFITELRDINKP